MKRVYLDHNATTPMRPAVRDLLLEYMERDLGNPSSLHASGRLARNLIDEAREKVAALLGVGESEILFTAGGTEANNLALFGTAKATNTKRALLTTPLEHPSILEPLEVLAADGHDLFFAAVDPEGRIDPERLVSDTLSKKVGLISVHLANNEIGVLQPIAELSARLSELPKEDRPRLHIDAVQAVGRIPLDLGGALRGVDLATLSMHKIGGPHGVGVLVRRSGCALKPRAFGGGQEDEMRAGTENAAAISAAALALELALAEEGQTAINHRAWSTQMWHTLSATFPEMELAGPSPNFADKRLPNTLNVRMPGTDARMLVTRFDVDGLELSAGSACASGAVEPSHVLLALGLDEQEARAGLRISLGWTTSEADCKSAVGRMVKVFSSSHATSDNNSTL